MTHEDIVKENEAYEAYKEAERALEACDPSDPAYEELAGNLTRARICWGAAREYRERRTGNGKAHISFDTPDEVKPKTMTGEGKYYDFSIGRWYFGFILFRKEEA